ncbi:helix-turn-helix domain-containing protein [Actinobacillus equuli subsp. haemolyticus]|uniref:Helix-turn-helix domain-containing protein n=1 Tax=Actinobacillus equuli subsp. equuli TaxID=202947 RepID=A0A9X4G4N3_ACTEU|nr:MULTISPECIES: Cro/CI family transcriptional regulator [Actinobacillus]MDE8034625.1 helix-turn-helix domain-containing protein [Actinobacillus equuli subsp. equuli]MDG4948739.1 helix-turn-helix domain-containing protein [Actinobacillus equuli subsp. haemolyticus]WGE63770.1 helix-turn-helix domain-containing protein [Actinobacillus equuli subsp. haemolyticus]VEB25882.1 Uncharacterized protein conserved in bacteria, prophage-related [Actinobacillus lignieresii]
MNETINKAINILGSQTALAEACGVTQGAVRKWLRGGGIDSKYLLKIEKATGGQVTVREICEEFEEEQATK